MLMRDILNYLYINRKDTILNNILFNGKSFIESISASNITSFTINHLINI